MTKSFAFLVLFTFCSARLISQTIEYFDTGEEFTGPLPGWKNIKTDFGAKGDGITDDAPAITAALYTFREIDNIDFSVLYFPSGTYRLGSKIFNADRAAGGTHYAGLAIIGEDPSNTILLWDGPDEGTMFSLDGWYLKLSRLTFDGQNKAKIGLLRDGGFGTGAEYSDLVFKDMIYGIQLGGESEMGQAENLIIRCRFINCACAVFCPNMNSLDTWLWYNLFQDCSFGIHLGGYQAFGNVFLRSKVCDLGLSWQPTCIVDNISVRPKRFTNYMQSTGFFQQNKIYDPDTTIIKREYYDDTVKAFTAPFYTVFLDNVIKTRSNSGSAIELCEGNFLSAGNTFTQSWPIRPMYKDFTRARQTHVQKSIDGDISTYYSGCLYCYNAKHPGIAWNCPEGTAEVARRYSVSSTIKNEREWDAKSFRLVGSNDWGYHITTLDSQTNQIWTPGETKIFNINNSSPYSYYRLEVLENGKGQIPGGGEYFEIAEFAVSDSTGEKITGNPFGFLTGGDEKWSNYYSLQQKIVPYDSVAVPGIIELPASPAWMSRKVFEVQKGTPDDATEIQTKIDSAAAMPEGSRPIVHIPKGIYNIKKTIFIPKSANLSICGDGVFNGGTQLYGDPEMSGPTLRILTAGNVLIRDIEIRGNEAIHAAIDDNPGGQIFSELLNVGGIPWAVDMAETAMIIDGIEQSDILFKGTNTGCAFSGILVKGGPVLSSGGSTDGQIAFLGGASSVVQDMWNSQNNGKLIAQGMWFEGDVVQTKNFINLTEESSGSLALVGMKWYHNPNPDRPIVSIDNFSGRLTTLANHFARWDKPHWWQISGDGSNAEILSACNGWDLGIDSSEIIAKYPYWSDESMPPAKASRIFCLEPDITDKQYQQLPDSARMRSSLELMRSLRIRKPAPYKEGDSRLGLIRVNAFCPTGGIAMRFVPAEDPYGRPESPVLIAPGNGMNGVSTSPVMSWSSSLGSDNYQMQISTSMTFNTVIFNDSAINENTSVIDELPDNSVLYWRVRAMNENGSSMWSPIWSFTTGGNTSSDNDQINVEFKGNFFLGVCHPNPFSHYCTITYSIPLGGHISINIMNSSGTVIKTLTDMYHTPGTYEISFNGATFPAGVYYYRMQAGNYSKTRKMLVIK